jgi:hypothetical protein
MKIMSVFEKKTSAQKISVLLLFLSVLTTVSIDVQANPIDPYAQPFISEVLYNDSIDWAIELDLNHSGYRYLGYYDSTDTFILTLPSRSDTQRLTLYNTRIKFDTAGIAILTRKSIRNIPANQDVILRINDIIKINTSSDTSGYNGTIHYFEFLLKPVAVGKTLVNASSGSYLIESSRNNFGKPNRLLVTSHRITIMNDQRSLISGLYVYYHYWRSLKGLGQPDYVFRQITDSTGVFTAPVTIGGQETYSVFSSQYEPNSIRLCSWTGNYIDSCEVKDTSLIINVTSVKKNINKMSSLKLNVSTLSGGKYLFVISAISPIDNAKIEVGTMDGRKVATIQTSINQSGTFSYIWDNKLKPIASGSYLCSVKIKGETVLSKPLIVQ